ncbi:alpha/beta fold hydrolase [Nonomuraea sp. MCN248]|uniref:Alpha/beta fold hydrolase n=1 Tax=Nonomuraea corallina TaxID=2989783 RepID=A0ABT4SLS6_9ACTN|nr:alpha/beta fold hydrolase [Nonomuraea corallina]MDA0638196.1 alpha/beta fold hydrolase [Nonomuraea corallina]
MNLPGVRPALVVLTVVVVLLGLLWAFQRRLIYLPDTAPVPPAAQVVPGAREVTLTTADGLRLGAWYVPGDHPVSVLVAGGNAGNRLHRAPLARALAAHGLPVLLMDYRGYGGNPGSPAEEGLRLDARAARDFLGDVPVIYFGESLGAAVVTGLAAERPPGGLVLRSPFTDLAAAGQVAYPFLPVRALLRDRFPVAERMAAVRVPVVVVYGTADTIVPPGQSRAVAAAAAGPATVVEIPGAGHNDPVLLSGPQVIDAVTALADRLR